MICIFKISYKREVIQNKELGELSIDNDAGLVTH